MRAPERVTAITTWPSRSRWIPVGRRSSRLPFWTSDGRTSAPTPTGSGSRGRASRPRAPAPAGLSTRELEVVRLVADGLANKAIATQLHLSVRTVESHVRHVLAKAG
ncbi:MAG: response regulator transcription factor [Solirubrobacteraceae bacterium]